VAIFLAVTALGGWVPRVVFLNISEVIAYSEQCGSKLFVVDHTYDEDNQGRGSLSSASFCRYKRS
jgi:hypothetical protein